MWQIIFYLNLYSITINVSLMPVTNEHLLGKIYHLYADGFRSMTIGRTLWAVIIVKLIVIFLVLRLFFFPDVLARKAVGGDKAEVVASELLSR